MGAWVERMERTQLEVGQRVAFATDATALRFPKRCPEGIDAEHLLLPRREADRGHDLWTTYNVIEEYVIKGGLSYRVGPNRQMHSWKS